MSSAPNPRASVTVEEETTSAAAPTHQGNKEPQQHGEEDSSTKTPPPLPAPTHDGDATQLPVGGEGVALDHLGPLVVNQDGTMSRIANWAEMAEIERQNTLRILGKRNQLRLDALRAKGGQQPSETKPEEGK